MATATPSKFNILGQRQGLDTKKNTLIQKVKTDLLDTLDIDNSLVDRNAAAESIGKNRDELIKNLKTLKKDESKKIKIGDKILSIINKKYDYFFRQYDELTKKNPANIQIQQKRLDKELAERLILDAGSMIQFTKGADTHNDAKETYQRLTGLNLYQGKIDLVIRKERDGESFVIKRTEKEMKHIQEEVQKLENEENEKNKLNIDTMTVDSFMSKIPQLIANIKDKNIQIDVKDTFTQLNELLKDKANSQAKEIFKKKYKYLRMLLEIINNVSIENIYTVGLSIQLGINELYTTLTGKPRPKKSEIKNDGINININVGGSTLPMHGISMPGIAGGINVTNENIATIVQQTLNQISQASVQEKIHKIDDLKSIIQQVTEEIFEKYAIKTNEKLEAFQGILEKSEKSTKEYLEKQFKEQLEKIFETRKDLLEQIAKIEKEYEAKLEEVEKGFSGKLDKTKDEITKEIKMAKESVEELLKKMEIIGKTLELIGENQGTTNKLLKDLGTQVENMQNQIQKLEEKIEECCEEDSLPGVASVSPATVSIPTSGTVAIPDMSPVSLNAEKEIQGVVAESTELYRQTAYEKAMKEMENDYKNSFKFGFQRAQIFFFRESIINKKIAKELKKTGGMKTDKETNSAVNRWMIEKAMGGEFTKNIAEDTKVFADPAFQEQLDGLVQDYMGDTSYSADLNFQTAISDLIMGNYELKLYMKEHMITHLGNNLLESAKAEKEERNYYKKFIDLIDRYAIGGILSNPVEFDKGIRDQVAKFIKEENKLPDMIKEFNLHLDDPRFAEKLAAHRGALESMRTRTVKIRLNLLTNISEEKKGLTKAQHVDRDKFDVKHARGFTRWMEKHPWRTTGMTALGLVGTGVAGALTMPLVGLGGGAVILRYINFLKKKGHYTQEHKKFEEHIIKMTPAQRDKYLEQLKQKSEKLPKRLRWVFPSKYNKYGESMEYFTKLDSIETANKQISIYLHKETALTDTEASSFKKYLIDAAALLHMHKDEGRNFMYSQQGQDKLEELYNDLHKTLLAGIVRIDPSKDPAAMVNKLIKATPSLKVMNIESAYDESKAKMKSMRSKLGVVAGSKSAGIYIGAAFTLGWISNQIGHARHHLFGSGTALHTLTPTATTTTVLDPAFGMDAMGHPDGHLLLQNIFKGDLTKYHSFVSHMQSLPVGDQSSTLRGTFKNLYGTDALANQKTHEFFQQFVANINDSGMNELVKLGTSHGPVSSIRDIASKMHSWYVGSLPANQFSIVSDPTQIQSLMSGFKSGAYTMQHLPAGWTQETASDALFCNCYGGELKDLIFDTVTQIPPLPPTPPSLPPSGSGVLSYLLPGAIPTVRNEVNKFDEKK